MVYDEKLVLRTYVLHTFRYLLTASERERVAAEVGRRKQASQDWWFDWVRRKAGNQEIIEWEPPALTPGYREFLDDAVARVLRENADAAPVNRCPKCRRVLRTPEAKICYWCGHSQYST